jgi:hypothetical protein
MGDTSCWDMLPLFIILIPIYLIGILHQKLTRKVYFYKEKGKQ